MGMFDSVMVPCPKCGKRAEFQSKGGSCDLMTFELENAPADVLANVNRHAPEQCECGTWFEVDLGPWPKPTVVEVEKPSTLG